MDSVKRMQLFQQRLRQYRSQTSLHLTQARTLILEVMLNQKGHFSCEELALQVGSKYPQIGTATVYRCLPLFQDAGIVKQVWITNQRQRFYEVEDEDEKDRIVCLDCQEVFEIDSKNFKSVQNRVEKEMKFSFKRRQQTIYGNYGYKKNP